MHRLPLAAATALLAATVLAQQPSVTNPAWQRARAVWFTQSNNPVGAELCLGMAQLPFDDAAKAHVADAKPGERIALGGDWATLDTFTGLEFDDVKVPKGSYYLALEKDKKGWALVFLDPAKVQKAQALPPPGAKDKPVARVPLQHKDAQPAALACEVAPDATAGTAVLKLSWGPHAWSATASVQGGKGASPIAQQEARGASRVAFVEAKAGKQPYALLDHGEPAWNSTRAAAADGIQKGGRWRLGENWWSTLDCNTPLVLGGKKIAPGLWHLSLQKTGDGGDHARTAAADDVTGGIDAFGVDYSKAGLAIPLTAGKAATAADKLQIRFVGDGTALRLAITFGEHELSTPLGAP